MEPIVNTNSTIWIDEDGVFIIDWKADTVLEKEDFQKVVEVYDNLSNGAEWQVLHLFKRSTSVSSSGRHYAENREKAAGAEAFVIESLIQRNLFKFYRKFRSVNYPMQAFSTKEAALDWLKELRN
jgi:hypothetical protein